MATTPSVVEEEILPSTVILGANVHRYRVLRVPKLSQETLHELSGVSVETIRLLERNRLPDEDQLSPHFDTLDRLAAGFRKAGVHITVQDLLKQTATPSSPTGQPRHLWSVHPVGEDLPAKR